MSAAFACKAEISAGELADLALKDAMGDARSSLAASELYASLGVRSVARRVG